MINGRLVDFEEVLEYLAELKRGVQSARNIEAIARVIKLIKEAKNDI